MKTVSQSPERIVILGGGYTGLKAALRLARKTRHEAVEVTLVNNQPHFVERIRLHQVATNQSLRKIDLQTMLAGSGVHFLQGWVTQIAPERRALAVNTAGETRWMTYDKLVYALGSFIDTHAVPGGENCLSLSTEESAVRLRERLPEIAARYGRVVVVGGGLTGIELTSEMAEAYPTLRVTLVTKDIFGQQLSTGGQAYVRETFAKRNIQVIDERRVVSVHPDSVDYDGGSLPHDLCLWAGSFSVSALAGEAGLEVNGRGQVIVDPHLRSVSHPDIYTIGDAAGLEQALNIPIRMACATGLPMAQYAADHIAASLNDRSMRPYDFRYGGRCISLGRRDGLIQMVRHDDSPKDQIITGRLAARIKEMICQYAFQNVNSERWLPGGALWARKETSPAQMQGAAT